MAMKNIIRIVLVSTISLWSAVASGQAHGWTVNPSDYGYSCEVNAVVIRGTTEMTTGTLGAFVGGVCRGYVNGLFFPVTGRTIFSIICYSNVTSGETLTFQYFNPSDNSYHTH